MKIKFSVLNKVKVLKVLVENQSKFLCQCGLEDGGGICQPETVKMKSKKENDKALVELELALLSGKKSKRMCHTNDQMAANALVKIMELSLKVGRTPSQELLKFVGVIPEEEEEVAMGMDNPNDSDYHEKESLHEEELFYEEGPLKSRLKTPHIVPFVASNTIPLEEEEEEEEEETKKKRRWPWTRPMKRNERRVKLGAGDPTQSALHLKEGVLPNLPCENYTMKESMKKKGKKMDLAELEHGWEELKLKREETAKMTQTFKESTFKDSPQCAWGKL
jgi:hypothetical protein